MALKTVQLENFRGKDDTVYSFNAAANTISGRNGSGKTTIQEAIAFAFCGTDSASNKNPQHLISDGATSCKVTVVTDRSTIVRSLTRKGNGSLRLIRGDNSVPLTQTEFEQLLGTTDLFLSAFIPGYFLALPTEKQHKVISEICPPVDRKVLFAQIAGFELSPAEQVRYALNRRADLVASTVANDRRDLERLADRCRGELTALEAVKPLPHPEAGVDAVFFGRLNLLKEQWAKYRQELGSYNTARSRVTRVEQENALRKQRRGEIQERIMSLIIPPMPPGGWYIDGAAREIKELESQRKTCPPIPSLVSVTNEPICSSCGQTVGLKHRERVSAQNEATQKEWQKQYDEVVAHNSVLKEKVDKLQALQNEGIRKFQAYEAERKKAEAAIHALELEAASLVEVEIPELPPEPVAPEEVFPEDAYLKAKKSMEDHQAAVTRFHYAQDQYATAQKRFQEVNKKLEEYLHEVPRLEKIEAAVKQIPQKELEIQAEMFHMPGINVTISETIDVSVNSIPYAHLSMGERLKVGAAMALRINSKMRNPINMLFLDNADLVDEKLETDVQTFLAEVDPAGTTVSIT